MFAHTIVTRSEPANISPDSLSQPEWLSAIANLKELDIRFEASNGILWQYMKMIERPSVTLGLIADSERVMDAIEESYRSGPAVRYVVGASRRPGIFSLGGDLIYFRQLIQTRDEDRLREYAYACCKCQYRRATRMNLPICTIALVQGSALGGGFEAALSHDVIIAERSAKFGLPEVLFNLFPGMGAYSFLVRRMDAVRTERLMLSRKLLPAAELAEMGIVDVLADDGRGESAVYDYVAEHSRERNARLAIAKLRNKVLPVSLEELLEVADVWVEAALQLDARDLQKMDHLVAAQSKQSARLAAE